VRTLGLKLVSVESLTGVFGGESFFDAVTLSYTLLDKPPAEGVPTPFRISVPRTASPTFRANRLAHSWRLDVVAEVAFGIDAKLSAPIRVRSTTSHVVATDPLPAPPVGRERFERVWSGVAASTGLAFDPENDCMRGATGGVSVEIALANAGNGTSFSARLAHPPLGVGLDAHSRIWTEALHLGEVDLGDEALSSRVAIRGRFEEQLVAFFDAPLRAALLPFDTVKLTDDGATLATRAGATDAEALAAFVTNVLSAARTLDAAQRRIPPPPPVATAEAAWNAYAERMSARFERGSMRLQGLRIRDESVDVGTIWEDRAPVATRIAIALAPRLEREVDEAGDATLSADAREAIREIRGEGRSLRIGPDAIEVTVRGFIADPAALEGILDRAAGLPRLLLAGTQIGPYR
jgi:hypothetical protein